MQKICGSSQQGVVTWLFQLFARLELLGSNEFECHSRTKKILNNKGMHLRTFLPFPPMHFVRTSNHQHRRHSSKACRLSTLSMAAPSQAITHHLTITTSSPPPFYTPPPSTCFLLSCFPSVFIMEVARLESQSGWSDEQHMHHRRDQKILSDVIIFEIGKLHIHLHHHLAVPRR